MFHKYVPHRLATDWLWHRNNKLANHASVLSHKDQYENPLHSNTSDHPFFNQQVSSNPHVINPEESAMTATASNKDSIVKKLGINSARGEAIQEKSAEVVQDFRTFVQDIESLIRSTTDLTGEDLAKAKAKLNERISVAKKSLESWGETISDRASKSATAANNYVHEKPWPVIGAGAALGFLAGYLLTNSRRDE